MTMNWIEISPEEATKKKGAAPEKSRDSEETARPSTKFEIQI
jgi:hypothetical protein